MFIILPLVTSSSGARNSCCSRLGGREVEGSVLCPSPCMGTKRASFQNAGLSLWPLHYCIKTWVTSTFSLRTRISLLQPNSWYSVHINKGTCSSECLLFLGVLNCGSDLTWISSFYSRLVWASFLPFQLFGFRVSVTPHHSTHYSHYEL